MRKVKTHEPVVGLEQSSVDRKVGRAARERLDVDTPLCRVKVERLQSTLLAQQVRELNARQRENRRSGAEDPGTMKGLKEATAVLKDLAAVARSLNDQGVQAEGTESGVVLLPRVEEEEP